jgi:hypothetical protein
MNSITYYHKGSRQCSFNVSQCMFDCAFKVLEISMERARLKLKEFNSLSLMKLQMEPSHQIISYYDNSFPVASMGLTQRPIHVECDTKCCTDVIITNEEGCLAIIFFIVAHDQGWSKHINSHGRYDSRCSIEARLMRDNVEIENYELFKLRHADSEDQVYICTLRGGNSMVCNLKCGDKICLYAISKYLGWTVTVKEVIVCVVHTSKWEVGEVQMTVKGGGHGGSTSNTMPQEMVKMFSRMVVGDNLEKQNNVSIQSIEDPMKISCVMVEVSFNKPEKH